MWKLKLFENDHGRCVWEYDYKADEHLSKKQKELFDKFRNNPKKNSSDEIYRDLALNKNPNNSASIIDSENGLQHYIEKGVDFYQKLQTNQGFWPGDYGGPMFLLPFYIIVMTIMEEPISENKKKLMILYIKNHQNKDGGWGTHIQMENSTMFGSVLNYVAARLLGVEKNEDWIIKGRNFIKENGGAIYTSSWAKIVMAAANLYDWKGINSLLPEIWILPKIIPFHPSRWWCHCRMVYLPMAYIYGNRITGRKTKLIEEIRSEIYCTAYQNINWEKHRLSVCDKDRYFKKNESFIKFIFSFANFYEKYHLKKLRSYSNNYLLKYIIAEDNQTNWVDIGPINKVLNTLCIWFAFGKDSKMYKRHIERCLDYLWIAEDGMKMQGYNGSQLWDTAFAVMAITQNEKNVKKFSKCLIKAYEYLDYSQIKTETINRKEFFRHTSEGGWPFSTLSHGWPISDCTSHGLTAVILLNRTNLITKSSTISESRLKKAVDQIMSYQNPDGGYPTYELQRGSSLLEYLNPSNTFDKIMVDYSYVELTGSALIALLLFRQDFPNYRAKDIQQTVQRGRDYLIKKLRKDGSWYGNWGVCFTYASFYAIRALALIGGNRNLKKILNKACEFLVSKQKEDGGWGETFESSSTKNYVQNKKSQVVNTAWALIALMEADYYDLSVIEKGINLLKDRQTKEGDWNQEDVSGVFNANCMITYTAYRNIFPIWAISLFLKKYK